MIKQNSLYLISFEASTSNLVVSIGLIKLLKKNFTKVAYFKPIVEDTNDNGIELILNNFQLKQTVNEAYCYTIEQIKKLISQNNTNKIYETIINQYKNLQKEYDFILIDGLSWDILSHIVDFDLNLQIAKNLNTSIIMILEGLNKSSNQIVEEINIEKQNIQHNSCDIFGIFVNNINKNIIKECKDTLKSKESSINFFLPYNKQLEKITLSEVYHNLDIKIYFGSTKRLNHQINKVKIVSMGVDSFLSQIEKGDLVVVSGDRSDILLSTLYSLYSSNIPQISGIVLTNGITPNKIIQELLDGLKELNITILISKKDTFTTATKIMNIKPTIRYKDYTKISIVYGMFSKYIDSTILTNGLNVPKVENMTPIMFEYNLFEKARVTKRNIVLNESGDDRILRATEILLNYKVVDITLIGDKETILQRALIIGINIDKANIIDPKSSNLIDEFAKEFYNLRKNKGILLDQAYDIISTNDIYFATMMVHLGYADGMVSGAVGTTANTVRPALQIIKTKKDIDIVSSLFFICLDSKVLIYADCAINPSPTSEQLAQIALSTVSSAKQFGIDPKVAMLSYATGDSGSGEEVDRVSNATKIVKNIDSTLIIDGPIQYDAAIDKEIALKKLPNSKLKGEATILIFPDLNTGNNTYKAVQRSSGAVAIGPILQGLNKPINDLSRGCKVADIINTVAITAIQVK